MAQEPQTRIEAGIQRMIDAGEPEENIATFIKEFKAAYPDEVKTALGRANANINESESQEVGPPISAAPPEQPPPYTGPTDWMSGFTKSMFGGEAMRASDESSRGWLHGAIVNLPHGLMEGAKMMATANPLGYAAYHYGMGKDMPAEEAGKNLIPSIGHLIELGKESGAHPYEFGEALGQMTGQPAMTEGLFGNVPGLPSGVDLAKGVGRGVEFGGRVMKNYSPLTDIGTRTLAGAAGYKYGGFPAAVLGAKYGGAPKFLKGIESAAGGAIERGGQWIRNIDGSITRGELEDFWGRNSPDAQDPIIRISSTRVGGARDPIMESPINPPDSEVPELRQFRESTNRNAWDPEETTVNETTDPILESEFNPPDAEILEPYQNWKNGPQYTPPPVTVNEAPLSAMDKYGMMGEEVPEPVPTTAVDPGRPLTAFEKYMRNKKSTVVEEAPMVNAAGEELAFSEPDVPEVAKTSGASINPDMEIKWPKTPTPAELSKMTAAGFQFDSATNIFRKFKKMVNDATSEFGGNETGTFTPGEMFENLKRLLGRDPSDAELGAAVRRQVKPGETTGAVAPFLTAEQRAERLADLGNTPAQVLQNEIKRWYDKTVELHAAGDMDGAMDAQRQMNIAEEKLINLNAVTPSKGTGSRFEQAMQGKLPSSPMMDALSQLPDGYLTQPSGDINAIRSQSVMNPRQMDPRMAVRVEAGGPREFDFTKPKDVDPSKVIDDQIVEFLKSEDAHPPEATDLNAWKKLKDLGKKLLGDESGEFDPNTLWWNLRRYFNRPPTEAELTRGMQIDPEFKPAGRLQGIKDEIEAEFQSKKPTATDEIMHKYGSKSTTPIKRLPAELTEVTDDLWDSLERGDKFDVGKSLIEKVKQHIADMTDLEIARNNRDDIGTMADNAVNDSQRAVFDALYDIADKKYRELRNPDLKSPKSNRDKPIDDILGDGPKKK